MARVRSSAIFRPESGLLTGPRRGRLLRVSRLPFGAADLCRALPGGLTAQSLVAERWRLEPGASQGMWRMQVLWHGEKRCEGAAWGSLQ